MSNTDALKAAIQEYSRIHAELSKTAKEMAIVKKQKLELGEVILAFLDQQNVDQVRDASNNIDLIKKESIRTEGIKKEYITKALRDAGVDVEKVMADIDSQRMKTSKSVLKCKKSK